MITVQPFDLVDTCPLCECGSPWIVDGDGQGNWWLLCLSLKGVDCVRTRELPEGYVVSE